MAEMERESGRPERRLGEYEVTWAHPEEYLVLPQIRNIENPLHEELKDSIREGDLLNHADAALIEPEVLATYLDFVNRTWKSDITPEDCIDKQRSDGKFLLLIAGGSRHKAVSELGEEEGAPRYLFPAKLHDVKDPTDIIAIQLGENLHSVPRQEQQAIAIVEQYLLGLENGSWKNKTDYLRQKDGMLSQRQLSESLYFAELPDEVKRYVFSGELHYGVAIEIGKMHEIVADHTLAKMGDSLETSKDEQNFKLTVNRTMIAIINHVNGKTRNSKKRLNITAGKKHVQGRKTGMMQDIENIRGTKVNEDTLFELVSAERQADIYAEQIRREFEAEMRYLKENSVEVVDRTLRLAAQMEFAGIASGIDEEVAALAEERELRSRYFGAPVLVAANA